ncbi:MAG: hypothetical protein LBE35_05665 [Clostridiales bacterium]|nr:hypothetical protein [Clostridiales bacterium]
MWNVRNAVMPGLTRHPPMMAGDSRFRGNDEVPAGDSRFRGNDEVPAGDSRFCGNDVLSVDDQ